MFFWNFFQRCSDPQDEKKDFRVTRLPLLSLEVSCAETCPPGDYCFEVKLFTMSPDEVRKIWDLALRATHEVGYTCTGGTGKWKEESGAEYNLAHALEHLAVLDLVKRGKACLSLAKRPFTAAKTILIAKGDPIGGSIFYFRKGLAPDPEEEITSVQNAIDFVNNTF